MGHQYNLADDYWYREFADFAIAIGFLKVTETAFVGSDAFGMISHMSHQGRAVTFLPNGIPVKIQV